MPASDIPVGTQFSPELISLRAFCQAAIRYSGDREAFLEAIWLPPVRIAPVAKSPTGRRRSLPAEAAVQYGLLDRESGLAPTPLCIEIAGLDEKAGFRTFAKHILLHCNGLALLSVLRTMLADDTVDQVNSDTIARYSSNHCGLRLTEHNGAINTIRMYLARAGLFRRDVKSGRAFWTPVDAAVDEIVGVPIARLEGVAALMPHQQAFLRALCTIDEPGKEWLAASVRAHAELLYPEVQFNRSSIVKDILIDLKALDLIEFSSTGTSGGKSARLRTTPHFVAKTLDPFLADAAAHVDAANQEHLRFPVERIRTALVDGSTHTRGVALEALMIRLMRALNLEFNEWRVRPRNAAYAEVDVSLVGVFGALPTKWQIQCKNTPGSRTPLEDIAREVGIAIADGTTHVLFITRGRYTDAARNYAARINARHGITVFLFDGDDLAALLDDFSSITLLLREHASKIVKLKRDP